MAENQPPPQISLLERREIEARIVGPLIRAFAAEFGETRTLEIVRAVIVSLAKKAGESLAERTEDHALNAFAQTLASWKEGGALELEILEQTDDRLSFNVTRCRYAELYRSLGLADLGASLSCQRDAALASGFNPSITLERSQTIMEGATFCDFRFHIGDSAEANPIAQQPGGEPREPTRASSAESESVERKTSPE
jgi:hypothetical protein